MPRARLAYEKPSRVSQGLVVGFSIAVVLMAGWFVTMVMFSEGTNTKAAVEADVSPMTITRAYVTDVLSEPIKPSAIARANRVDLEPTPLGSSLDSAAPIATPPPPRSPLPLASLTEFSPGAPRPALTTSPIAIAIPETSYRGILADELSRQVEAAIDAVDADVIQLPLPRPRPNIPVPRPRPHIDGGDGQSSANLFDFLTNGPR
ncbi:MAG TPA: hypothetical protein VLJ17_07540 [Xanthobacteraceae bacterium]|nr:hypothetical protein [Xanthobacteraceae bacterium]